MPTANPPSAACLPQVTAVAGSAGGLEATPPSDRATAVLTSPNSTEVQHLALGYPLDMPEGECCLLLAHLVAGHEGWSVRRWTA